MEAIRRTADRVLGQALSVATAGQLPPGVIPISKPDVIHRVVELAEAGQRLRYEDALGRVLLDLGLDWQGARKPMPGFDRIIRENNAGREWRDGACRPCILARSIDGASKRDHVWSSRLAIEELWFGAQKLTHGKFCPQHRRALAANCCMMRQFHIASRRLAPIEYVV